MIGKAEPGAPFGVESRRVLDEVKAKWELELPFRKKFEIFVGSNEEAGMGDIKSYAKKHGYPDMGLVVDASFP